LSIHAKEKRRRLSAVNPKNQLALIEGIIIMEYGLDYPIPIITSDDVRVISRYVSTGKLLPLTAEDVKKEINDAPDTLVAEILDNYNTINTHAKSWEKTQQSMITISAVLVGFSKDIHEYGDEAVKAVENMEGYKYRKIGDLTESELNTLPQISLDGGDQCQISTLEQTVKYIKDSIHEKKRKSSAALVDLDSFKNTLVNTIAPWIGKMIQVSNPDALDTEISNIRRDLIKLAENTNQVRAKPSFMQNIMSFAVDVAEIMSLQEQIKSADKPGGELIKRRDDALNKLSKDNKLKGVLQTLNIGMGSLYDVVNPAITATQQLHSHWENILLLIDDSSNQFKTNANYAYLGLFVRKLKVLLLDWRNIENNATTLMNAFRLDIR